MIITQISVIGVNFNIINTEQSSLLKERYLYGIEVIDGKYVLLSGSIKIRGGILFIKDSVLMFSSREEVSITITVEEGGNLTIIGSRIIPASFINSLKIIAEPGSHILIDGCEFIGVQGIFVKTNDAVISNSVMMYGDGIYLSEVNDVRLINDTVIHSINGIYVTSSSNNVIKSCVLRDNEVGLRLFDSRNNEIKDCVISNNGNGLLVLSSKSNDIENNVFEGDGVRIDEYSIDNVFLNNTVNSKPLVFISDKHGYAINGDAGEIIILNSSAINIRSISISNTDYGVIIINSSKITIDNSALTSIKIAAISIINSDNLTITRTTLMSNLGGLQIFSSSNIRVADCNITNNNYASDISSSDNVSFIDSIFTNSSHGLFSVDSVNLSIINSEFINNDYPIEAFNSSINIDSSRFINNSHGVELIDSSNNRITNNVFVGSGLLFMGMTIGNHLENNTVNDKPLIYLENTKDMTLSGELGQLIMVNSSSITVKSIRVIGADVGLELLNGVKNVSVMDSVFENNSYGIYVELSSNITLDECSVSNSDKAITIISSMNILISNSTIINADSGISIADSSNINVVNSSVSKSDTGLYIEHSDHVTVANNKFLLNNFGAELVESKQIAFTDNQFTLGGVMIQYESYDNSFVNNTVNNKPLIYLEGVEGGELTGEYGQVIIVKSSSISLVNVSVSNTNVGVEIFDSEGINIRNSELSSNYYGIYLLDASSINITKSSFINNNGSGVYFLDSRNNILSSNRFINNTVGVVLEGVKNELRHNVFYGDGVLVGDGRDNELINNTVNGKDLIYLEGVNSTVISGDVGQLIIMRSSFIIVNSVTISNAYAGVEIVDSSGVLIIDSSFIKNNIGVYLFGSYLNAIISCEIVNNDHGLLISWIGAWENTIIYNDFINNTIDVSGMQKYDNKWFTILPLKYIYEGETHESLIGNYWSSYSGVDSNSDGICDQPYGMDNYPLAKRTSNYKFADTDGDGVNDLMEMAYGTNPFSSDTDGDGYNDGWELGDGTNPLDWRSHPLTHQYIAIAIGVIITIAAILVYVTIFRKKK